MKKKKMSDSTGKKEDKKESGGIIDYLSKHLRIGSGAVGGKLRDKERQDAIDKATGVVTPEDQKEDMEMSLKDLRKKRTAKR